MLQKNHPDAAAGLDLARFTFELDQYGVEVQTMVDSIFSKAAVRTEPGNDAELRIECFLNANRY